MATISVRLPNEKYERLKELAKSKNLSVNKMIEEFTTIALTEFDTETRFKLRASSGSIDRGLELVDKLKRNFNDGN